MFNSAIVRSSFTAALTMGKYAYYAVHRGFNTGVFRTWDECQQQIKGYANARFKGFHSWRDAENFVINGDSPLHLNAGCNKSATRGKYMYYAVQRGFNTGVFHSWGECERQVKGFAGARFKGFNCEEEAASFVAAGGGCSPVSNYGRAAVAGPSSGIHHPQTGAKRCISSVSHVTGAPHRGKQCKLIDLPKREYSQQNVRDTPSTSTLDTPQFSRGGDGVIEVYTDGACTSNGMFAAEGGVGVYWGPNHPWNYSAPLHGRQTNSRAELHAIIVAVRQATANDIDKLRLYSDSVFCINSMKAWIKKWRQNGWKKADGKDVINKDDFMMLDEMLHKINVDWVHVRGHQGIPGNEAADRLAVEGIQKGKAQARR